MARPSYIRTCILLSAIFFAAVIYIKETDSWNSSLYLPDPVGCATSDASLTLLVGHENAKCMDGSPPGYYIRMGNGSGISKWHIHFEGGGWCYSLDHCIVRASTVLGSSSNYPACLHDENMKFYMSRDESKNPLMYNWNSVLVKYCDASSYAGNAKIKHKDTMMYFYGRANRDLTISSLLERGMKSATEVVISGCSAGGLGVYLGLDEMSQLIRSANRNMKVRGLIDSGFFMDYTSDTQWRQHHKAPDEAVINGTMDYATTMKMVYSRLNMSAGADRGCVYSRFAAKKNSYMFSPSEGCVFARNLVPHITTPLFAVQPQYDQWQIWHVVGKPYDLHTINEFGHNISHLIRHELVKDGSLHGAFLDACTHHCTSCSKAGEDSWNGDNIRSTEGGDNVATAFNKWYSDSILVNTSSRSVGATKGKGAHRVHLYVQDKAYPCNDCCICHA